MKLGTAAATTAATWLLCGRPTLSEVRAEQAQQQQQHGDEQVLTEQLALDPQIKLGVSSTPYNTTTSQASTAPPPWSDNAYLTASGEFFSPVAMNAVFTDDLLSPDRTEPWVCRHRYDIEILRRDPLVIYVKGFLQTGEAEHLITLGAPLMNRSGLLDSLTGKVRDGLARTSSTAFLEASQDEVVECVEERAAHFANEPKGNMEPLQVVWYKEGQEYKPHFDFFDQDYEGMRDYVGKWGQRKYTFFVYLNDRAFDDSGNPHDLSGGATEFPKLGLSVPPKKGDAVFWANMDTEGRDDKRLLHAGRPVERGEKFGLNVWIRNVTWSG